MVRNRVANQFFRKKSIDKLIADADAPGHQLRKTLGPWSLTALGIGAIIGTGIFVLTGTAAAGEVFEVRSILKAPLLDALLHGQKALGMAGRPGAGPGIALSFLLVAMVCALAGLCYAELASMICHPRSTRAMPMGAFSMATRNCFSLRDSAFSTS